jgi:PAS domain S-box-containing protein
MSSEVSEQMAARPVRSTARLAAILDRLPEALLLVDAAGLVENANAKALETFGARPNRPLIGLPLGGLLPALAGSSAADFGTARPRRIVARGLDGMVFGVEATCASVPWGGGEERLLVSLRQGPASGSDADAELLRTGRATQAVLRSTEEAICGVDLEGRVLLANPAAGRMFGIRISSLVGTDLHAMVMHTRQDGTSYPAADSPVARTIRTGRRIQRRREIVWRVDGTPVPVEISTAVIRDGSEIGGIVVAFTDLSDSLEQERRRRRLLDLLRTRVEPGLAAAGSGSGETAEALAQLLSQVREAVGHEDLMDGQLRTDPEHVEVSRIIGDAVACADLTTSVPIEVGKTPGAIRVDVRRLTAAVVELLRIAASADEAQGPVRINTEEMAGRIRILVSAPGLRAPAEILLSRLNPRSAPTGVPEPDLAFVQLVAEDHRGLLLLESNADAGRSYVLELPTAADAVSAGVRLRAVGRHHAGQERPVDGLGAAAAPASGHSPDQATNGPSVSRPAAVDPATKGDAVVVALSAHRGSVAPTFSTGSTQPPTTIDVLAPAQVLVWPRPGGRLAEELTARGLGSVALDRRERPVIVPVGTSVVLVDPQDGPLSRRTLTDLGSAAAAAGLPLVLAAAVVEIGPEGAATDPTVLLAAVLGRPASGVAVLVVEEDPALAGVLIARLIGVGCQAEHARDDSRAAELIGDRRPDLVLRNLAVPWRADPPGWPGEASGAGPIPVIAYTANDLRPGHQARLQCGDTVLGVAPRGGGPASDERLAEFLAGLARSG